MASGDIKDFLVGSPESAGFTPDKFLSQKATGILGQIPGEPLMTELIPSLLSELDGFKDTPGMLSGVVSHADHWFQLGLSGESINCEGVSYDPIGLIGLKFDNPKFQAVVIQPDEDGDNNCRINIVADGVRHEYKVVGGQLLLGFHQVIPEESSTYKLFAHMGVDVATMDTK